LIAAAPSSTRPSAPARSRQRSTCSVRSSLRAKGFSLHGLRKTLGNKLAEHGATTRELMECSAMMTSSTPSSIRAGRNEKARRRHAEARDLTAQTG
jgi:hypothetical protein